MSSFYEQYRQRQEKLLGQIDSLGNQGTKPFVDISTGIKRELDSEEGSMLAQTPNSGVALDPNKHYVLESPDYGDIKHFKGSDPQAYEYLKQGYRIQNNTLRRVLVRMIQTLLS